jgi:hypothetical protein
VVSDPTVVITTSFYKNVHILPKEVEEEGKKTGRNEVSRGMMCGEEEEQGCRIQMEAHQTWKV